MRAAALLLAATINVIAPTAAAAPDLDVEPVFILSTEKHNGTPYERVVVLAAPFAGGHVGIIINKPADVTMRELFPDFEAARNVVEPLYFGGENMQRAVFALAKSESQPSPASTSMSPGVWLVPDAPSIDRIIETTPSQARYFIGRLHWLPGALRKHVDAGALTAVPADPSKLFLPDTSKLYDQLTPAQIPAGGRRL